MRINDAVSRDEVLLIQRRGEIIEVNHTVDDCALATELMNRHVAHTEVRTKHGKLTSGGTVTPRDLAIELEWAGDSIVATANPVISQLRRAEDNVDCRW